MNRPGAQAAASNFGWLLAEKLARLVLNVGVGFWVARYLGPAAFGELSYALAVVGIAMLLAELGLDGIVRRELIREPASAGSLLSVVCALRFGGAVVAWVIVAGLGAFQGGSHRGLLAVLGLVLFQPVLWVSDLWFQATLKARTSVFAQILAQLVGAVGRIMLISVEAPLIAFAAIAVLEMLIAGALLAAFARSAGLRLEFMPDSWPRARQLWAQAWLLLISGFAVVLYLRIDVIMLRVMSGAISAGVFSAAVRFTEIWYFLPGALASSLLPALLRSRQSGAGEYAGRLQAFFDLNAGLAYLIAVPLAFAAPTIITIAYGSAYGDSVSVMQIHLWSSLFVFLGVARGQYLINEGRIYFYLWSTVAGLIANVVLNLLLIPRWGPVGAAWATLAAQAVAACLSTACYAPLRSTAGMQLRALLIPFRWFPYVRLIR